MLLLPQVHFHLDALLKVQQVLLADLVLRIQKFTNFISNELEYRF